MHLNVIRNDKNDRKVVFTAFKLIEDLFSSKRTRTRLVFVTMWLSYHIRSYLLLILFSVLLFISVVKGHLVQIKFIVQKKSKIRTKILQKLRQTKNALMNEKQYIGAYILIYILI